MAAKRNLTSSARTGPTDIGFSRVPEARRFGAHSSSATWPGGPAPKSGLSPSLRHFVMSQVLENANKAGMVPALPAEGGGGVEQLLGGRGVW